MTRRAWLLGAAGVAACTSSKVEGPPALPKYAGDWTLETGPVTTEGVVSAEGAWAYAYSGNPAMKLVLYEMPSQTVAFDAVQKWRAEAGKLAFYKGAYFGIVDSQGANHTTLNRFAESIRSSLPDR